MKKSSIKLSWKCSKRTEAERIGYTVNMLLDKSNRYTHSGMLVLPYSYKNAIYLPPIPQYLMNKLAEFQNPNFKLFTKNARPVIDDLTAYTTEIPAVTYMKNADKFTQIFPELMRRLNLFMPDLFSGVKEICIRPTIYGTSSSEISSYGSNRSKIEIYWRIDTDISAIPQMLIGERFFVLKRLNGIDWKSKMLIRDFLMTETILKELFPDYHKHNITDVEHNFFPPKLFKESEEYLKSRGLKVNHTFWHDEQGIHYRGKDIRLTKTEKQLMKLLIDNIDKMVTYDALSQAIWGLKTSTKFSLNAIAKMVQRIRKKMQIAGIEPKTIEVYSGEGYKLLKA